MDLVRPPREPRPGRTRQTHSREGRDVRSGQPRGTTKQTHVGPTDQFSQDRPRNTNRGAGQEAERLLAGRTAVRFGADVGAGDGVDHHLVHVVRRRELGDPARAPRRARRSPSASRIAATRSRRASGGARPSPPPRRAAGAERLAGAQRDHHAAAAAAPGARPPRWLGATDGVDGEEGARLGQLGRGPERRAVELERLGRAAAREVVGEDVGQALLRRQPRRVVRGAQQPDRRAPRTRRASPAGRGCARARPSPTPPAPSSRATLSTYSGKRVTASSVTPPAPCRRAQLVTGSVPGARPMPRSIRPGYAASSSANCSATTSGAWLGSITPPEPTRIRCVAAATSADQHRRVGRRDGRHVVVLGEPVAAVAELVGDAAPATGSRRGRRRWSGRCGPARGRGRTAR